MVLLEVTETARTEVISRVWRHGHKPESYSCAHLEETVYVVVRKRDSFLW